MTPKIVICRMKSKTQKCFFHMITKQYFAVQGAKILEIKIKQQINFKSIFFVEILRKQRSMI